MNDERGDNVFTLGGRGPKVQPVATRRVGQFLDTPRRLRPVLPRWMFEVDATFQTVMCNSVEGAGRYIMARFPNARAINFLGVQIA